MTGIADGAARVRRLLEQGRHDPSMFREALLSVPPRERDAWVDLVLGLREIPPDGPDLPRDCVPYLPCTVDALLRLVDQAKVGASDVFVDVGSGVGRAATLVHLLTGASAVGIEIQAGLVGAARDLAARLTTTRIVSIQGDAARLTARIVIGTVFFLYCPFSGERLAKVLADLEDTAQTRRLRVCCVDLPLPACSWLTPEPQTSCDLMIYTSR